jgi:hypothetical protein
MQSVQKWRTPIRNPHEEVIEQYFIVILFGAK